MSAALLYIRQHACQGIQVVDVARQIDVSRSTLRDRFQRILGQTPGQYRRGAR